MSHPDKRCPTSNTNEASAIGALKIPFKPIDPITLVQNEQGRRIFTYWFEERAEIEFCGEAHQTEVIKAAWIKREDFELKFPEHPLNAMRKALDKCEWLTRAWRGRIQRACSPDKGIFTTEDITLASVLMAAGHRLIRLDKPRYVFGKIPVRLLQDFNLFDNPKFEGKPACLMRRVLECRNELLAEIRKPETILKFTSGFADDEAGRVAFIAQTAPAQEIDRTLDLLYHP